MYAIQPSTPPTDASIVEDNVQPAKLGDGFVDHAPDLCLFAHVALDCDRPGRITDLFAYQRERLFDSVVANVGADDVGTFSSEQDGRLEANAALHSRVSVASPPQLAVEWHAHDPAPVTMATLFASLPGMADGSVRANSLLIKATIGRKKERVDKRRSCSYK
jgi:hypothetical protein